MEQKYNATLVDQKILLLIGLLEKKMRKIK